MRRRPRNEVAGVPIEAAVLEFTPEQWPGANDWEKYEAWREAREEWAKRNLPGGVADLPFRLGSYIPDMPFDGTGI
jgi:hypothetical protein